MSKLSNVLSMMQILHSGRKYSIRELADMLEVTPRTIRVYKEELEMAGIYVESIRGPYGGYFLRQNIELPERFVVPKEISLADRDLFNLLNRAKKEKRKCYIEYSSLDPGKKSSLRTIYPYEIFLLGNEWGVAAYCEYRKEIRHFYLNRIRTITLLEENF